MNRFVGCRVVRPKRSVFELLFVALLTSLQNPTVKHLAKMRDNRSRRRAGRVLVDGWREVELAMRSGLEVIGIYTTPSSDAGETPIDGFVASRKRVIDAARDHFVHVNDSVMAKISYGQSPRGVVAEFVAPNWGLQELDSRIDSSSGDHVILVLDHIEKPGNIGASLRCADAIGVDAVIMIPAQTDSFNPNIIRSSLGAVFTTACATAEEPDARAWLAERGYQVYSARVESSRRMWDCDFSGPSAIVIGSEANGLGSHWKSEARSPIQAVHIPMSGNVDSLNASVSAAVLLYEVKRQQRLGQ